MSETVNDTLTRLTSFVTEAHPSADVGPGSVINELLLKLAASVQNQQYNEIAALSQGRTLKNTALLGTGTYTDTIDNIAANYGVSREQGAYVTGKLKVSVASPVNMQLYDTFLFTQPSLGLNYRVAHNTRINANAAAAATLGDTPIHTRGAEHFFIIDVVAEGVGTEYVIPSGTSLNIEGSGYITDFVRARAYGNFIGGLAKDDDAALVQKITTDFGSARLDSPAGIQTRLRKEYPAFQSLSAVGAGDVEMTRSKNNVLGISTFGKADIYVRTSASSRLDPFTKTATKVGPGAWTAQLSAADAPGFYKVAAVLPIIDDTLLGGTLQVTDTVFSYTLPSSGSVNEISSAAAARFTKYQTATVSFLYDDPENTPVGGTMNFEIYLNYLPDIAAIQDMFLANDSRILCADYLVRAALPCFVSLDIALVRKNLGATETSIGIIDMKKEIFNYINTIPFGQSLEASRIVDICHNYSIQRVDLPITMYGAILCNDGSTLFLESSDALSIPYRLDKGVTDKTTQYFVDYYKSGDDADRTIESIGIKLL